MTNQEKEMAERVLKLFARKPELLDDLLKSLQEDPREWVIQPDESVVQSEDENHETA